MNCVIAQRRSAETFVSPLCALSYLDSEPYFDILRTDLGGNHDIGRGRVGWATRLNRMDLCLRPDLSGDLHA